MANGVKTFKLVNSLFGSRISMVTEVAEVFNLQNKTKKKLMELINEKAARAHQSEIVKKIKTAKGFYTLEMAPPSFDEMQKVTADIALFKEFFKSGCYKYLTVKQAWLLFLVATEVSLWFFLGETIGKMHFVGYLV